MKKIFWAILMVILAVSLGGNTFAEETDMGKQEDLRIEVAIDTAKTMYQRLYPDKIAGIKVGEDKVKTYVASQILPLSCTMTIKFLDGNKDACEMGVMLGKEIWSIAKKLDLPPETLLEAEVTGLEQAITVVPKVEDLVRCAIPKIRHGFNTAKN